MANRIQYRRDTAANWTSANPILAAGEPALETDTGNTKLGDGVTAWNSLAYISSVLACTGVGDETSKINAWLAKSTPLGVKKLVGNPTISAPLVISSQTYLDASTATITLATGSTCNMLKNAAVTAARSVGDFSTTAASTTITSATAAFVAGDVGKPIRIYGAGSTNIQLDTTIVSVTNATTAVLTVAPSATLTNAAGSIGPRDSDITVTGGTWNRTNGNGSTSTLTTISIMLRRVDRLTVQNGRFTSTDGKYGVSLGDVTDYRVDSWSFNCWSDGVHVNGPAFRGKIKNISGVVGDDLIGITTNDTAAGYGTVTDCNGPISNLLIEDAYITGLTTGGATPNAAAIYGDTSGVYQTQDVTIRRVSEQATTSQRSVMLKDVLRDVTVDQCTGVVNLTTLTNAANTMYGIRIRDHRFKYSGGANGAIVILSVTVDDFMLDGLTFATDSNSALDAVVVGPGSTMNEITARNVHHINKVGRIVYVYGAGTTANHVILDGCHRDGVDYSAARAVDSGTSATLKKVSISNSRFERCQYPINFSQSAAAVLHIGSSRIEGVNDVRADTSAVRIYSSGNSWSGNGVTTINSGTVSVLGLDFFCDISKLAHNVGDIANNTSNANTGTLGVGPAVCTGIGAAPNWKSLVTGATF